MTADTHLSCYFFLCYTANRTSKNRGGGHGESTSSPNVAICQLCNISGQPRTGHGPHASHLFKSRWLLSNVRVHQHTVLWRWLAQNRDVLHGPVMSYLPSSHFSILYLCAFKHGTLYHDDSEIRDVFMRLQHFSDWRAMKRD